MNPHTEDLVSRFAQALKEKLSAAEQKYGFGTGWMSPDWMDECRAKLREHILKGDPRDVAAYCAFLWYHGEGTSSVIPGMPTAWVDPPILEELISALEPFTVHSSDKEWLFIQVRSSDVKRAREVLAKVGR